MRQTNQPVEPSTPKLLKRIDYTPPVQISYEDMRKQRIKERISQRAVKISNLFSNAV